MFEVFGLLNKPEHRLRPVVAGSHILDCGCSMISSCSGSFSQQLSKSVILLYCNRRFRILETQSVKAI